MLLLVPALADGAEAAEFTVAGLQRRASVQC